eukprot:CAMPEP_0194199614 /NCGR_PEP_ID=MMETSP0156-20130528/572_1 /TAXON_ID=33649 /ORGANISM="Thalassionema nitzschioides, Strain L26-B" /LENGTH=182 /DNA_ID=CAMNT_0038924537 /DNA_START=15 /DNA_END=563 /DNA_ORIENTATION=-
MKAFTSAIALLLASSAAAFSPLAQQPTSSSLNLVVEGKFIEGLLALPLIGAMTAITQQREALYASGAMKAKGVVGGGSSGGASGVAIEYDAAARLAFKAAGGKGSFDAFKVQYEYESSFMCAAKAAKRFGTGNKMLAIEYDAAARLAFAADSSATDYAAFKEKYEKEAVKVASDKKKARDSK